jgi:AcrR family transcriptional regulator
MKELKATSPYQSPLRAEQKEATRQRILDAAGRLMEDRGLEEFSFASIAKEAGVKERTVYRHFPTKAALIESLCEWFQQRIHYGEFARTEAELLAKPEQIFPGFEENEQLARALWSSPQGRAFRLSNVEERKAGIKAAIADAVRDLPPRQARWIAAVIHALLSSATWQSMKDYWNLSGEEAGKASSMAMELLLNAVRANVAPASKYKNGRKK